MTDFGFVANHVEDIEGEARRKCIVQSNPFDTVHGNELAQQVGQSSFFIQVKPVKYIGVGEGMEDLQEFRPKEFVDSLF